jgi:hypothetical protein
MGAFMKKKYLSWLLFIVVFISEGALGFYACYIKGFVFGDGISRVASAFYVLYIRPPHLAAIGTTWNPLPSLLELPFMLLWPFFKPIASFGLAGVIMTATFAAGSAVLVYAGSVKLFKSNGIGILLALLYCLNPMIFVYGCNGKAEVPFCFMLLWFTYNFIEWMEDSESYHMAYMAIALALAFLIRYEIFAISGAAFLGLAVITLIYHKPYLENKQKDGLRYSLEKVEGRSILLLTPMIYTSICWVLYDWIITGNPFYFMNSTYSNLGFIRSYAANATLNHLVGNPIATLEYVYRASHYFFIPLVVIIGYRIYKKKLFEWDILVLLMLVGSTVAQQAYMLFKGISAGAVRYFIYPIVFTTAWLPYEFKKMHSKFFIALCMISFLFADIYLGVAWFNFSAFKNIQEEIQTLRFDNIDPSEVVQRDVAKYIDSNIPNARILMDSVRTYNVILSVNHPQNLVVSCSYNFKAALNKPQKYHIDYILVPSRDNDFNLQDAVNIRYPKLYENGAKWCVLAKQFGDYLRLYRVITKDKKDTLI